MARKLMYLINLISKFNSSEFFWGITYYVKNKRKSALLFQYINVLFMNKTLFSYLCCEDIILKNIFSSILRLYALHYYSNIVCIYIHVGIIHIQILHVIIHVSVLHIL